VPKRIRLPGQGTGWASARQLAAFCRQRSAAATAQRTGLGRFSGGRVGGLLQSPGTSPDGPLGVSVHKPSWYWQGCPPLGVEGCQHWRLPVAALSGWPAALGTLTAALLLPLTAP